nr:Modulator protein MzrA [Candidatus Pantoea persica]
MLILTVLGFALGKTPIFRRYEDELMFCLMLLPLVLLLIGLAGALLVLWRKRQANQSGKGGA